MNKESELCTDYRICRQTLETVNAVMCVIYVNDSNQPTPQGFVLLPFHSISFLMQVHFSDGASTLIKVLREMGLRINEEFQVLFIGEDVDIQKSLFVSFIFYTTHCFAPNSIPNLRMNIEFLSNQR